VQSAGALQRDQAPLVARRKLHRACREHAIETPTRLDLGPAGRLHGGEHRLVKLFGRSGRAARFEEVGEALLLFGRIEPPRRPREVGDKAAPTRPMIGIRLGR